MQLPSGIFPEGEEIIIQHPEALPSKQLVAHLQGTAEDWEQGESVEGKDLSRALEVWGSGIVTRWLGEGGVDRGRRRQGV